MLDLVGDLAAREAVERPLGHRVPLVVVLAGERDDRAIRALALPQVALDRVVVLDRPRDAAGDDHRTGLPADHARSEHMVVEVVDHDFGLEPHGVVVALDVAAQLLVRASRVELGIGFDGLDEPVVALDRRVVGEHVEDEAFLDGLLHRVGVKRAVLGLAALRVGLAEDLASCSSASP
jgi:hypothetical protein